MLYDLCGELPPHGSLLESVFMLLSKRRMEQEYLRTKVLIKATLAPHFEKVDLKEAWEEYADAMFPYLKRTKVRTVEAERRVLKKWTEGGPIKVTPLWKQSPQEQKRLRSQLQRGADRVAQIESMRRAGRLRRLG